MKKTISTIFWLFLFVSLFTLLGGGRLVQWIGWQTVRLGKEMVSYERSVKKTLNGIWEEVEKKGRDIKKGLRPLNNGW